MKTRMFALAVLAVLMAACAAAAPQATVAESTPTASSTPAPTEAPSPTPRPTTDARATQRANAAAEAAAREADEAAFLAEHIAPDLETADLLPDGGKLVYRAEDPIRISSPESNTTYWEYLSDSNFVLKDYVLSADISWDSTGFAGCNVALRAGAEYGEEQMQFRTLRLSGIPYWDMIILKSNRHLGTINSASNTAIKVNSGDVNHFVFVVRGANATVYANGVRLGIGLMKAGMTEGMVYLTTSSYTGSATCTYSNLWVWELAEANN
jgi:hypothetical protein